MSTDSRTRNSSDVAGTTVKQTTLVGLEPPKLKGMSMEEMIEFKRKRTEYESIVTEKNREPGVSIQVTSYRNSVEVRVLRMMWRAKWIVAEKFEEISEEQIKECIEKRSIRPLVNINAKEIDRIVKDVKMKTHTVDPSSRVWTLALDYEKALEDAGYQQVLEKCPHIAIEHMIRKSEPGLLKTALRDMIRLHRNEGLHKKDFFEFIEKMVAKAIEVDQMERLQESHTSLAKSFSPNNNSKYSQRKINKRNNSLRFASTRNIERGNDFNDKSEEASAVKTKKLKLACLFPKCNGTHRIKDCPIATPEEKKKYLNLYLEEKKKRQAEKRAVRSMVNKKSENSSTLFSASFLNGAVEGQVLADIGSDINVLPPKLFGLLRKADPNLKIENISPPLTYNLAVLRSGNGERIKVTCSRKVETDTNLRIRHGSELILRRLDWLVCDQDAENALLGRPLLERLGINARHLLDAACSEHRGSIDVPKLMGKNSSKSNLENEGSTIASLLRDGVFHRYGRDEDDYLNDTDMHIDIGDDPEEDLNNALEKAISSAIENGISRDGSSKLSKLLKENYKSIFKLRLGKSSPAKVRPMEIILKESAVPIKVKARRYSSEQRSFMKKYVAKLVELGFIIPNQDAVWQCAPLLVHKPNSVAKFRMTIDLRPINEATVKQAWPMPHIDSEISDLSEAKFFAKLDFVSGYWQLPVHKDSQNLCGIVTPDGVYTSTRVLQGLTNATSHFQGTIEPLFKSISSRLKAWLDDFMLFSNSEEELLILLEKFFKVCGNYGLYLSAKKCEFFKREVKWCGRIISEQGYKLDPQRLSALKNWTEPKTAGELCEFVHCCRWMSINIPAFTERVEILNQILEQAYKKTKRRTKKSIKNIPLRSLSWGTKESAAFISIQESIRSAVNLSHPKKEYVICVYTDASEEFWSAVVTQASSEQLNLPILEQKHEPLAFLGGKFRNSQERWSMYEKEGFAILSVFKKLDYMLLGSKDTHVFTDHRNLLFVYCPSSIEPALGRHIVAKVQRWALYLSRFNYAIEHIPGSENVFADILTRWLKGYRIEENKLKRISSITESSRLIIPSSTARGFIWPNLELIKEIQEEYKDECSNFTLSEDGLYRKEKLIYIPKKSFELQLKLLVVSHCGLMGHRGVEATESVLSEEFYWEDMNVGVKQFVQGCIHCIMTRAGAVIPRPLSHTLHGTIPNEVVHMDFLYMGSSTESFKYLLLMKDDMSGYVWMRPFVSANSEAAAELVSQWIATFSCMKWLVTDQGSHFLNSLISELTQEYKVEHHFVTAYSPWANGTVERVCREVLRACRSLLSEWRLAPQDWPSVVPCVQSILNHSPLKRLGLRNESNNKVYRTPLECFTGIKPTRPLLRALPATHYPKSLTSEQVQIRRIANIKETQNALEEIHKSISAASSRRRAQQTRLHNSKTNIKPLNLREGDFVLVRRPQKKGHKLNFLWFGPRRITGVKSELVYEVENLITKKRELAHARRLLLYRADMDNVSVPQEVLSHAEHSETVYETVKKLHDIRLNNEDIEILIEWDGMPDREEWSWEPLEQIAQDVPQMTRSFLQSPRKRALKHRARTKISFN